MSFQGIIPPLITPLKDPDTLDVEGLERLLEHMISGGVHGIFALGTTGEGPCLSYKLRIQVILEVCRIVKQRIPVLVAVTDTAMEESARLAQVAAEAGVDSVVLTTPYYFPAGQTELTQYVEHILPKLPLPVMLYNIPSLTKVWFEIDTLSQLSSHDQILGVKDSSGDLDYFAKLVELKSARPDWSLLVGPEAKMIDSVRLGGSGGVNGGANIYPRLFVEAYQAAVSGDAVRASDLQKKIEDFGQIYEIGQYASRVIKVTKCAASILGLCDDCMAEPFNKFYPEDRAKVETILKTLNLNTL
ncbi:dihydrodipicolinate synthase family protein [Opitutia bacterium ISCC 51]|nr:dihydrodipicolinate synthase family protein [Opitutae bacterium ISCC 51]QXD30130.1 dihydrodipicolinate synthase family protein [Opitutae bacterium ISCC 52]